MSESIQTRKQRRASDVHTGEVFNRGGADVSWKHNFYDLRHHHKSHVGLVRDRYFWPTGRIVGQTPKATQVLLNTGCQTQWAQEEPLLYTKTLILDKRLNENCCADANAEKFFLQFE